MLVKKFFLKWIKSMKPHTYWLDIEPTDDGEYIGYFITKSYERSDSVYAIVDRGRARDCFFITAYPISFYDCPLDLKIGRKSIQFLISVRNIFSKGYKAKTDQNLDSMKTLRGPYATKEDLLEAYANKENL